MTQRRPIVVVGSINMDLVVTGERLPGPGETISGTIFQTHPGGKGANQAVAAARLGYPVRMIGMVGDDDFGEQLRRRLGVSGVDTSAVHTVPGSSGIASITVAPDGENSIVVVPGANGLLLPGILDEHAEMIRDAGLVLAQLEIPLETILALAQRCTEAGVPLILNPAPARSLPAKLFRQLAWFTPNETEAAFYSDPGVQGSSRQAIGEGLLSREMGGVVLTLGSAGSYLADSSGTKVNVRSFPVAVVDTTGAGDAFNGAFAVALMMHKTPAQSALFASAASAISVTRSGAQASMATLEEVEALIETAGGSAGIPLQSVARQL